MRISWKKKKEREERIIRFIAQVKRILNISLIDSFYNLHIKLSNILFIFLKIKDSTYSSIFQIKVTNFILDSRNFWFTLNILYYFSNISHSNTLLIDNR